LGKVGDDEVLLAIVAQVGDLDLDRFSACGTVADRLLEMPGAVVEEDGNIAATLPAAPNGSMIFCSDCNSTCTAAGSLSGRTCFREGGVWKH
jgi:hypothetical protein